ncbi:MAG: histidine kinase [Ginsengibacter sp.]
MLKSWYLKEEEKQILITANANAEIQLLKAQIHPHFLFNTLNNIYSFTLDKSPVAGDMVLQLSDMMRYMINDCDTPFVPLSKELKMMSDYIALEKVRYGNRLDLQIAITGETANKQITPLLMIPFLENCFKHGTSKMLRDAWIKVFIQADENVLHFTLANSKPADEFVNGKGGIGLNNVKKRLGLIYGADHLLTIESSINTFTVNMQIPLRAKGQYSARKEIIFEEYNKFENES